jgi:purine-binding chemotaxis protein CheW
LCALPLENVIETMRVLPIEKVAQAPQFVLGLCLIRGSPAPVVEIGALFGEPSLISRRMITVRTGTGIVALLVESVLGLRSMSPALLSDLPPLLRNAAVDVVAAIGTLDAELLLFLRTVRILPDAALLAAGAQTSQ